MSFPRVLRASKSIKSISMSKISKPLRFHIITLFKEACEPYINASIIGRAQKEKKIEVVYQNPRDFVSNAYGKVDERPYGGGPGMVLQAMPIVRAVEHTLCRRLTPKKKAVLIWLTPGGTDFTNTIATKLTSYDDIVLVSGRYEGIDERALRMLKTLLPVRKYSTGHYTLTGGELPAMTIIDAITRRIKGVPGNDTSIEERRIASHEIYTRPEIIKWKGKDYRVPKVLTTGNHARIDQWKKTKQ